MYFMYAICHFSCLCVSEVVWKLFGFHTFSITPPVRALAVHLPGQARITWTSGPTLRDAANAARDSVSPLERYFYRPSAPEFDQLTYTEYYEQFIIQKKQFAPNSRQMMVDDSVRFRLSVCLSIYTYYIERKCRTPSPMRRPPMLFHPT